MCSEATALTEALDAYREVVTGLTEDDRQKGLTVELKNRLNTALGKVRTASAAVNNEIKTIEAEYVAKASQHEGDEDHMEATKASLEEELMTLKACYKIPSLISNGEVQLKEGRQPAQKRLLETFKDTIRKKAMATKEEVTLPELRVLIPLEAQQRIRTLNMSTKPLMQLRSMGYRPSRSVATNPNVHQYLRDATTNLTTFIKSIESTGFALLSVSIPESESLTSVTFTVSDALSIELSVHRVDKEEEVLVASVTEMATGRDIGDRFFDLVPSGGSDKKCPLNENTKPISTISGKKCYQFPWLECLYTIPRWGPASALPTDRPSDLVLSHLHLRMYCTLEDIIFLVVERYSVTKSIIDDAKNGFILTNCDGGMKVTKGGDTSVTYPIDFPYSPLVVVVKNDSDKSAALNYHFGCHISLKGCVPSTPFLPSQVFDTSAGDQPLPENATERVVTVTWTPTGAAKFQFTSSGTWERVVK